MQWAYGITTVWQDTYGREHVGRRRRLLPRTIESIKAGGFKDPTLFVDGCPFNVAMEYEKEFKLPVEVHRKNIQTHGNWFLALHELYIQNCRADRYAIFQDDMVTYTNLRPYLEWCPYPSHGYLNLYTFPHNLTLCPRSTKTGQKCIGWFPSNQRGLGAVALVFNNEACRSLLSTYHMVDRVQGPTGSKGVDGGITESLRSGPVKYPEYCHNPSLVQHVGMLSTIMNNPHSMADGFMGEEFNAMELVSSYSSHNLPIPSPHIQLG